MKTESLGVVLASGNVLRCHTIPCLHRQTVGQHTWRTMVLLHWIYHPTHPPSNVTYAMLMHDVPEVYTGDTPGDVKLAHTGISDALAELERSFEQDHGLVSDHKLSIAEDLIVSICDRADLTLYTLDEAEMGNKIMISIAYKAYQMVLDKANKLRPLATPWQTRVEHLLRALSNRLEDAVP